MTKEGPPVGNGDNTLPDKPTWDEFLSWLPQHTQDVLRSGPPALAREADSLQGKEANHRGGNQTLKGPAGRNIFRLYGVTIDFGRAILRYRLVEELWNSKASCPRRERDVEDVIEAIWGERATTDNAFRDLCFQVRKAFREAAVPLSVKQTGGKVWLEIRDTP